MDPTENIKRANPFLCVRHRSQPVGEWFDNQGAHTPLSINQCACDATTLATVATPTRDATRRARSLLACPAPRAVCELEPNFDHLLPHPFPFSCLSVSISLSFLHDSSRMCSCRDCGQVPHRSGPAMVMQVATTGPAHITDQKNLRARGTARERLPSSWSTAGS